MEVDISRWCISDGHIKLCVDMCYYGAWQAMEYMCLLNQFFITYGNIWMACNGRSLQSVLKSTLAFFFFNSEFRYIQYSYLIQIVWINLDHQIFIKSNGTNLSFFSINVRISRLSQRTLWLLLTLLYYDNRLIIVIRFVSKSYTHP